jgi:hypothetical protein
VTDDDPHSEMLDLGIQLSEALAAGQSLNQSQRMIADILWIDTMVSPNGLDGWLYETSSERLAATRKALAAVGCSAVAVLVDRALSLAQVMPEAMSDDERQTVLDALPDDVRDQLSELDDELYDATAECMAICRAFVRQHAADFKAGAE